MATLGPLSPGSAANVDDGASARVWTNPSNVLSSDNQDAEIFGRNNASQYLVAYNFGAALPSGATIDGIKVEAELASGNAPQAEVIEVALWSGGASGSVLGTAKTPNTAIPATDTYLEWGGASDKWGATLSEAVVEATGFGVALRISDGTTTETKYCDHIRITITYTEAANPIPAIMHHRRMMGMS